MAISGTTEELLWNVSYQAVLETMFTRQYVLERRANLKLKPATEHEETTTSNLLRHLGYYGQQVGAKAVQHTKSLEGGLSRNGRQITVPSGADLELAVEVSPGVWLDLLLQAKTLKASGTYSSWSSAQNQKLVNWASAHGRIPAMLLYNDLAPPFVASAPPTSHADYACAAFGACASVNQVQLGMWASTGYCIGPARTPAGISLCLDQALMLTQPASPAAIHDYHFQIEHLLHIGEHGDHIAANGTTLLDLVQGEPDWVSELLAAEVVDEDEDSEDDFEDDREVEVAALVSAVIPFVTRDQG